MVFAAGAYSGKKQDFQIDQSGHAATRMDVIVNHPAKPVVLMLGAYEPTVWNIGWTPGTRVVGILASGYHRQAVAGFSQSTTVMTSTYDNRGACGYFYVGSDQQAGLNPLSRKLFGRPVSMVYPATDGQIVIGAAIPPGARVETSADIRPESYIDRSAPKAGEAGLVEAVNKGILRKSNQADMQAWVDAVARSRPAPDTPPVAGQSKPELPRYSNAYVVLKPFTYPAGLYGAHSAVFFIPRGVPQPQGDPGHSTVYDFNTLRCQGGRCSSDGY
ncbi:hypothetical protein INR99_02245 [Chitinilyticum litopenaei]|uniref:Uncharacterized protein n=1 Tax=Chitinilyticum piscinae TaxID=2866724 RepID=A0A8J7FK36_9NEIS|nr:hypothetical protein [Chitinilyticum piscinae]